ncbi:MAG: DUF86 domain-containing protein [Methanomassiliicoccaceae archaeon]|nr:DUF86 domain-containing protein [Methanomassiliicoccaceae archaeon]
MKNDAALIKMILAYCNKIDDCVTFFGGDEEDFLASDIYQSSCAFYILQIGELVKSISPETRSSNDNIRWKGIIGFRNVIVHNYGGVRPDALWNTIVEKIPELRSACEEIMAEIE